MARERKTYNPGDLERAEKMHSYGVDWKEIAEIIGHSPGSLATTRSRIKNGHRNGVAKRRRDEIMRRRAYSEELLSLGMSIEELAALLTLKKNTLRVNLAQHGLDRETVMSLQLSNEIMKRHIDVLHAAYQTGKYGKGPLPSRRLPKAYRSFFLLYARTELQRKEIFSLAKNGLPKDKFESVA